MVCEFLTKNIILKCSPFKKNMPGEDWFLAFKARHNLSIKKPEMLEYSSKKATDPFVIEYFSLLEKNYERVKTDRQT